MTKKICAKAITILHPPWASHRTNPSNPEPLQSWTDKWSALATAEPSAASWESSRTKRSWAETSKRSSSQRRKKEPRVTSIRTHWSWSPRRKFSALQAPHSTLQSICSQTIAPKPQWTLIKKPLIKMMQASLKLNKIINKFSLLRQIINQVWANSRNSKNSAKPWEASSDFTPKAKSSRKLSSQMIIQKTRQIRP